jgi:hypothetical protein
MYGFAATQTNDPRYDLLSLEGCGLDGDGEALSPWDKYVNTGFGSLVGQMGVIHEPNIPIEVHADDDLGDGTVRTPMLELTPFDFEYVQTVGFGYPGMMAVSDVGGVYEYQPAGDGMLGGWFKRIARGFKRVAKKVVHGVRKKVRKVMAKTRVGRALIKIGDKAMHFAMKIVKPLAKVVGKWATRLAPIAALIPGVGPAISGAMLAAGTVGKLINKYGGVIQDVMVVDQKTGVKKQVKQLKIDPKKKAMLTNALRAQAEKFKKMPGKQRQQLLNALNKKNPATHAKPSRPAAKSSIAAALMLAKKAQKDYGKEVQTKIVQASRGNKNRQQQIARLVQQLSKLGFRFG